MKECRKCKEEKDLSEFHRHKARKDGRTEVCKKCRCTAKQKPIEKEGFKICYHCKEEKELTLFNKQCDGRKGVASRCKICYNSNDAPNVRQKKCTSCFKVKRANLFGKKSSSPSGLSSICLPCKSKADSEYRKTESYKVSKRKSLIDYRKRKPKENKARWILRESVNKGFTKKSSVCELCGDSELLIHGHHWDYDRFTDVVWCCYRCHADIHNNKEAHILRRQNDIILHHIISGEIIASDFDEFNKLNSSEISDLIAKALKLELEMLPKLGMFAKPQ